MIATQVTHHQPSLFGGVRIILLLTAVLAAFHYLDPLSLNGGDSLKVAGDYSLVLLPNSDSQKFFSSTGEEIDLRGLWKFTLKNEGSSGVPDVSFRLPFNGVYKIAGLTQAGEENSIAPFRGRIQIGSIPADKEISLLVWSNVEAREELAGQIDVQSGNGNIDIEYPVRTTGFLAWVEQNRSLISLACLFLFLFVLLG